MYRVLIADDDILMREALNVMIAKASAFKVVSMTGTGESAVRACKEDVIDIVFMDMQMQGITGLEASRIIHQSNPGISIYILSAHAANVLIRSAAQSQIKDVLEKPITYSCLRKISELFPINEVLIPDRKTSELWLFRVMDYLFRQNSIGRYPLLENIFIYIEKHIKEDITLNRIIENCAISQGYLSRIFREQFKVSVTEYLHMRKLHLAKGYFYFTEDSIAEVAFRLGYNESSYFSKVFKKFENMTVKQYKNKIRRQSSGKKTEI